MADSDEKEIYKSTSTELKATLEKQLEARSNLKQRSVSLLRINILVISVLVTGLSFDSLSLDNLYLLSSIFAFLYTLWTLTLVFHPTKFGRGISAEAADTVDENIDTIDPEQHYRNLMLDYRNSIKQFRKKYPEEKDRFENGLWASFAGILLSISGVGRSLFFEYHWAYDIFGVLIILIIVFWGRDM